MMKHASSARKSVRNSERSSVQGASAGPNGVAIAPPAYGIDVVDRGTFVDFTSANADSSIAKSEDENQDVSYTEYRGAPFRIGNETHQVVIKTIGEKIVAGVASDFKTLEQIEKTLLDLASQTGHELEGKDSDIQALFKDAKAAHTRLNEKFTFLTKALRAKREFGHRPSLKASKSVKEAFDKLTVRVSNARRAHSIAEQELAREVAEAVEAAWVDYGDFLGPNLTPVSAVFRERDFKGNTTKHRYFTGADSANAIPIVWYKAPDAYPTIVTAKGTRHLFASTSAGSVTIGTKRLGVDDANRPDNTAFILRKVAHDGDRAGQKEFNEALNSNNAGVLLDNRTVKYNALGSGGFDGDHVKDLGFGGMDTEDNYWPLLAQINRRAFNGYNSGYIVNYINEKGEYKSKSIGGLIGKYFRVKAFMPNTGGAIPDESATEYAGTNDIKP